MSSKLFTWLFLLFLPLSAVSLAGNTAARHILVLGNSITLHPPRSEVGWSGNWGMAASKADNDYAHLLQSYLAQEGQQSKLEVWNISNLEKRYQQDATSLLHKIKPGQDLVVVALGDNVSSADFDSQRWFKTYDAILRAAVTPTSHLACVSTWWGNVAVDQVIEQACSAQGGRFVDIHRLYAEPTNRSGSERHFENAGVASHPGDRGMQKIAQAVIKIFKSMGN